LKKYLLVDKRLFPYYFFQLGLKSAPAFIHFPSKGKRKAADTYDIQRVGYQAETLAKWVAERADVKVSSIFLGLHTFKAFGPFHKRILGLTEQH